MQGCLTGEEITRRYFPFGRGVTEKGVHDLVTQAVATGASAASQNAIDTGVLGGMISATVLGVFFVPVSFVFVMKLFGCGKASVSTGEQVSETAQLPAE